MLEFLLDNPVVLIFLLIALSRILRKKKESDANPPRPKTGAQVATGASRRAAARAEGAANATAGRTKSGVPLEQRLEQLALEWKAKLEGTSTPQMRPGLSDAPGTAATARPLTGSIATPTQLEAATPLTSSLTTPTQLEASTPPPRTGSIATLTHFEDATFDSGSIETSSLDGGTLESSTPGLSPWKAAPADGAVDARAFGFHSTVEEPERQAYHLDTFNSFHSVSGARTGGKAEGGSIEEIGDGSERLFTSDADLRRAFVLSEVLGRPRAMRSLSSR